MKNIYDFFKFQGNLTAKQMFVCMFFIEVLRVAVIQIYASLSLPQNNFISFITYFPLMATVLYLYGATIAARLRNLALNPSLTYFWVMGIWAVRYIIFPNVQTLHNTAQMSGICLAFIFLMLPLFAKNKETLQFWKS